MQIHMQPGHKFRKTGIDSSGNVHFEVVDKTGNVVQRGSAEPSAVLDLRGEDGGEVGTVEELTSNRRMAGDPRQNNRV